MSRYRYFPLCVLAASAASTDAQVPRAQLLHYETVSFVATEFEHALLGRALSGAHLHTLNAFGRDFILELQPNAVVNELAQRLGVSRTVKAYRGRLADQPDSWIRLVDSAAGPAGLIWDGRSLFAVESGDDSVTGQTLPTMFRLDDLYVDAGSMTCGSSSYAISGSAAFARLLQETAAVAQLNATHNLDLGVVADFEFSNANSADPSAALLTRINDLDGIFSEQVGVRLTVAQIDVFESEEDPFAQSEPSALLTELGTFRGTSAAQSETGLTHLFTGRNLNGTTVGIAYLGAVCGMSEAAGLSEATRGPTIDSLIAAHEIGHSFGAPHDGDPEGACATTPETFIMAPSLSVDFTEFSQCSIEQMQAKIDAVLCLTDIDTPDLQITSTFNGEPAPIATQFQVMLNVANLGAASAAMSSVSLTTSDNLSIVQVATDAGNCVQSPSSYDCDLGDIAGGASRTVDITLLSTLAGDYSLSAVASSLGDTNDENNVYDAVITVASLTDLGISAATTTFSTQINGTIDVRASLSNDSDVAATDVFVTGAIPAGLRIDAATLGTVACERTLSFFICSNSSLAGRSAIPIEMTVIGATNGTHELTLTSSAAQLDGFSNNDEIVITVQVRDPTTNQGSGGGGATGAAVILALAGMLGLRRRRSSIRPR